MWCNPPACPGLPGPCRELLTVPLCSPELVFPSSPLLQLPKGPSVKSPLPGWSLLMLHGWDVNPNCSWFGSNNGNKTSALTLCHPPMCVFMVPEQGRSRACSRIHQAVMWEGNVAALHRATHPASPGEAAGILPTLPIILQTSLTRPCLLHPQVSQLSRHFNIRPFSLKKPTPD